MRTICGTNLGNWEGREGGRGGGVISIAIHSLQEGSFQIYLKITAEGLKFYSIMAVSLIVYDLEC